MATSALHDAHRAFAEAKSSGDEDAAEDAKARMKHAKARWSHAIKTQHASKLRAMLDLVWADASVAVRHEDLDRDPMLLNVTNGTIDLRTGKLRPHRRDDLITKVARVAFDASATCPKWDAFLHAAQGGNEEMLTFLRRARGYMLTGLTTEHVMFFLFGKTGTGKSTYFVALHDMLGDYAVRAPRGLLLATKGERHETGLTTVHGARVVTCSEVDEGAVFDEALVKDLTGGESLTARRMGEDHWSWVPSHKLLIPGNHKPAVRNFDDAIRRRMRLVPFTVQPSMPDMGLSEKLRAELPGILADAVRGCLEWQAKGLGEPVAVRNATDQYQDESDVLGEFFRLYVRFDAGAAIARKTLRIAYEEYAKENGLTPVGAKRFSAKLRTHEIAETTVKLPSGRSADGWRGVRLLTDSERLAQDKWSLASKEQRTSRDQIPVESPRGNSTLLPDPKLIPSSPLLLGADELEAAEFDAAERAALEATECAS